MARQKLRNNARVKTQIKETSKAKKSLEKVRDRVRMIFERKNKAAVVARYQEEDELWEQHRRSVKRMNRVMCVIAMVPFIYIGRGAYLAHEAMENNMTRPDQAVGITVTKAKPANEIVGVVNLEKVEGNSYLRTEGGVYEDRNAFSVQLNTYVHVKTGGLFGRDTVLWVQDVVRAGTFADGKLQVSSEIYKNVNQPITDTAMMLGVVGASDHIGKVRGRGKIGRDHNNMQTYEYTATEGSLKLPIHMALDIKAEKVRNNVKIDFSYVPIVEGRPDWKREVTFDTVEYDVGKRIESVKMEFSKSDDTGLTISGFGSSAVFYAQKLEGSFAMYAKEGGKLVGLPLGGKTDHSTGEGSVNVHSIQVYSNAVTITAGSRDRTAEGFVVSE